MNEEEKKAIEKFGRLLKGHFDEKVNKDDFLTLIEGEVILNLIEKQQKGIEKKDRQIDLMAECIGQDIRCVHPEIECNKMTHDCTDCVKQYFKNKAEVADTNVGD